MEKNIFQLDNEQLKEIARSFKAKVEQGGCPVPYPQIPKDFLTGL